MDSTLRAWTNVTQELPGVIAFCVAVVPMETNCIVAHWFYSLQLGHRPKDRQQLSLLELFRLSWPTVLHCAQGNTIRAGTCISQEAEAVLASVVVLPLDHNARAGAQIHLHGFGIDITEHGGWLAELSSYLDSRLSDYVAQKKMSHLIAELLRRHPAKDKRNIASYSLIPGMHKQIVGADATR